MPRNYNGHYERLTSALHDFQRDHGALPGLQPAGWSDTLVLQMISSLRRVEFVRLVQRREQSIRRLDPYDPMFDPIKAAHILRMQGKHDEAVWITFFATQFGKHASDGWKLSANVFGSFGDGPIWTAANYGRDRVGFENMLYANTENLGNPYIAGRFSNHRQYESRKPEHLTKTFSSAFDWIFSNGRFIEKLREVHRLRGQEPTEGFDELYHSMVAVYSFGRLARFDFLTMLGKLDLAPIEPGSTYLIGATGPLYGAKLLLFGDRNYGITGKAIQPKVDELDSYLKIGKQPLEDSLCNWQKNPQQFELFKG